MISQRLTKPPCSLCGSKKNTNWHHLVYSPVQVMIPLCHSCHMKVHKNVGFPKIPWKHIVLALEDDVYEKLKELKGDRSWEQFLVEPHIKKEEDA